MALWRWLIVTVCVSVQLLDAADVCVEPTPHKDVNPSMAASMVEKVSDSQQCLSRCGALKDTLPCRGATYVETRARGTAKALCKMYAQSAKGNLIDVTDLDHNDAVYYDIQDQCSPTAQRISVDGTGSAPAVAPSATTSGPSIPSPGGVVFVQPGPGSSIPGPAPGPDQGGSGGLPVVPQVGTTPPPPLPVTAAPTMAIVTTQPTQRPIGPPGGGAFVPGPNGAFVPPPQGSGGDGGQGGNGAAVGPDPPPGPGGGFVNPQPGGGVYPQPVGSYTPPPAYGTGGYAAWTAWGQCTVSCGGGVMYRNRVCGSGSCQGQGPDKELKTCFARRACPQWGPWTEWGPCSASCTRTRTRGCQAGYGCMGSSTDTQSCSSSYGSCGRPQPQPQPYVPVYVPRPAPAPPPLQQPHSYYDAIYNQYYRNRG